VAKRCVLEQKFKIGVKIMKLGTMILGHIMNIARGMYVVCIEYHIATVAK